MKVLSVRCLVACCAVLGQCTYLQREQADKKKWSGTQYFKPTLN